MNLSQLNYEGSTLYRVSPEFMVSIRTYSFCIPSMCPEFDPNPEVSEYISVIDLIDLENSSIESINAGIDKDSEKNLKRLKEIYKLVSEKSFQGRVSFRKELWSIIRALTPYSDLSAKLQERQDQATGNYPNPLSKYFSKLTIQEIEQSIEDIQLEAAQNLNDWKMYNDRVPENYSYNKSMEIKRLKNLIELKQRENISLN